MLTRARLASILDQFHERTIALVGDLFLDRYLEIDARIEETSIETGLPAHQVTRIRNLAGALGTVMNNLAALGVGRLLPVTVIGEDGHGFDLLRALDDLPVSRDYVLRDPERLTPTYTKPMRHDWEGPARELHRLDVRTRGPLSSRTTDRVCRSVRAAFAEADGVLVLDQVGQLDAGVVNRQVRRQLAELLAAAPEKLVVIDSRAHLDQFNWGVLKGNERELCQAAGRAELAAAGQEMARRTGQCVFATSGADGVWVFAPEEAPQHAAGIPVEGPIDIVGAGDSVSSGIVASLLSGATPREAAELGNLVASITIQQLGTTGTATAEQVQQRHARLTTGSGDASVT